jgi:hypothetical protein
MRAVQITRFGGLEVLDVVDLPDPVPGPGQQLYECTRQESTLPTPTTGRGRSTPTSRPPTAPATQPTTCPSVPSSWSARYLLMERQ